LAQSQQGLLRFRLLAEQLSGAKAKALGRLVVSFEGADLERGVSHDKEDEENSNRKIRQEEVPCKAGSIQEEDERRISYKNGIATFGEGEEAGSKKLLFG
jgi:hypothetical protein